MNITSSIIIDAFDITKGSDVAQLITTPKKAPINAKLIDIAGPLDFSTNEGRLNTLSGPMPKDQTAQILKFEKDPPEVSLFFDIDYWVRPGTSLADKEILSKVRDFSGEVWDLHERLRSIILDS